MCTYAAPGVSVNSFCFGVRLKFPFSVEPATLVAPTFFASFSAFFPQSPVMM
jgi:hypothetical protein